MGMHGGNWWAFISHDEEQAPPVVTKELLLRVWQFARPYRGQIAVLLFTIVLITGLSLLPPLLIRDLIDNALPNGDVGRLNLLALGLVAVPLVNGIIGVWQRHAGAVVGEGIIYDLRRALFNHMQSMSLRFFTETRTGELMSRLNNDVVGAQTAVTSTMVSIISNVISVVSTLAIMIALEWRLTLAGMIVLPLFALPARRVGRILRDLRRRSMENNAEMNAVMSETLNVAGALLVKLFGREDYEMAHFSREAASVRDIGVRSAVVGRWFFFMLGVVSAVGTAVIYWAGGHLVFRGAFSIGLIVAFGSYLRQLYGPLMSISNIPVEFAQSMVSFERVFEVLDIPIDIVEKPGAVALHETRGQIRFDNVSFSYQDEDGPIGLAEVARFGAARRRGGGGDPMALGRRGRESEDGDGENGEMKAATTVYTRRWALQDVSFTIEPGELTALVGPSGSGKTTITYLIPRLYDPTMGRVCIDGHDLRDVTLDSLAANIGMVTQDSYLFYDTIRANLLYARPDASDAEMIAAAKAANIHDFVMGLPEGYDTVVGERGYRLSGGERQRISIARVVLKNPRVLVLDEATSHLDSLSEALIQEALQRVMQGRTSLVIAHRLATILAADKILVLNEGRLVETGSHEALLAQGGLYTRLYETQFRETGVEL